MAEELFGVALRLVYRSTHPALAAYVTARAAPPGPALARLQDDLAHLDGILTAARDHRSVEAREEELRQASAQFQQLLASWERGLPKPVAETSTRFDATQLRHALSVAAGGNCARESLFRLLRDYGNHAPRLLKHLKEYELPGAPRSSSVRWRNLPSRTWRMRNSLDFES